LSGDMTHVVKLFGDSIVAEQTEKGTYIVRKGEQQVSPYEYTEVRQLTPKCWAMLRKEANRYDLIFANGAMQFGFRIAYALKTERLRRRKNNLIGLIFPNGTAVIDDSGYFLAFIPRPHYLVIAKDRFLVALVGDFPEPYVRVYDMFGEFLAEGFMNEALQKAKSKAESL